MGEMLSSHRYRDTAVGDLNSQAKGSGARDNHEKPALHWFPWKRLANSQLLVPVNAGQGKVKQALKFLGDFQCGDDYALSHLLLAAAQAAGMSMQEVLAETSRVLDFGAQKYAPFNWAKGMSWNVVIGCIARHLYGHPGSPGMWDDPTGRDADSGLLHVGHVGANVLFLIEYMSTYREGDDRPPQLRA